MARSKAGRGATAATKKTAKRPSMAVRRARFLEHLRRTANVARAARESGLSSSTAYQQRARLPQFAAAWDAAINEAMDELEDALIERAKQGVEKPVYFRGEQVGSVRSYSDALGMFLLKAKRPEVYARLQGSAGEGDMTQEEARAEVERRLDRLAGDGLFDPGEGADGDSGAA